MIIGTKYLLLLFVVTNLTLIRLGFFEGSFGGWGHLTPFSPFIFQDKPI